MPICIEEPSRRVSCSESRKQWLWCWPRLRILHPSLAGIAHHQIVSDTDTDMDSNSALGDRLFWKFATWPHLPYCSPYCLRTSVNWELQCENYSKNYSSTVETTVDSTAGLDLWFGWVAEKDQIQIPTSRQLWWTAVRCLFFFSQVYCAKGLLPMLHITSYQVGYGKSRLRKHQSNLVGIYKSHVGSASPPLWGGSLIDQVIPTCFKHAPQYYPKKRMHKLM